MNITIPELSLVLLIGASGAGKSTFARTHFKPTEIVSSDFCRGLVSDDENNQEATGDAFDLLHYVVKKRLARGLLTVIDATNLQPQDRKSLLNIAKEYHFFAVAIAFNLDEKICFQRNQQRPNRNFGIYVVRRHTQSLRRSLRNLKREGFRYINVLTSVEEADLKLAPFHLLATEDAVHTDKSHLWHLENIANICQEDSEILHATNYRLIDVNNDSSIQDAIAWWSEITNTGSEGIVVKPLDFIVTGNKGLIQPALKCRGQEYLRIIYGAEYTLANNLERLRKRGLDKSDRLL